MAGIYIHIPFCAKKCIYCDFYSLGARNAPWEAYTSALLSELKSRLGELRGESIDTLYIGGGTPSLIPPREFRRLAGALRELAPNAAEFTVEVNPDDVTPALVEMYRAEGVNRVSMGVQSLEDGELRAIGRRHTAARALEAYGLLRALGNVSVDLIFGLPGQTPESWERTVRRVAELRPEHVSAYSLMWEEGTALSVMRRQGRVKEAPEGWSLRMYSMLSDALAEAGYVHYEISNYALPGRESRHNSSYWAGVPYLGLGAGAHSYDGLSTRRSNPCDAGAYTAFHADGAHGTFFVTEELSREELREEYVMTRLRTARGIDLAEYARLYGEGESDAILRHASRHLRAGHLAKQGNRLSLSPDAVMLLDSVTVDLL